MCARMGARVWGFGFRVSGLGEQYQTLVGEFKVPLNPNELLQGARSQGKSP